MDKQKQNEQALQNLYAAARLASLKADEHDLIRKCAEQIAEALKAKETPAQGTSKNRD